MSRRNFGGDLAPKGLMILSVAGLRNDSQMNVNVTEHYNMCLLTFFLLTTPSDLQRDVAEKRTK